MAMGSTGTINVTPEQLQSAITAVETYQDEQLRLANDVGSAINDLIPGNFSGSAAEGYFKFYEENVKEVINTTMTNLLNGLREILQGALKSLPGDNGVDEQLGTANAQASGGASAMPS